MIEIPEKKQGTLVGKIGNRILAGFLLILPIALTLYIVSFLYGLLTNWADRIIQIKAFENLRQIFGFEALVRLFSFCLVLLVLFSIGTVVKYTIGKRILTIIERWILKIPLLNIVYSTIQQIIDAVKNPKAGMFRKVVLFEYPRKGLYVIGFLTNENTKEWELREKTGKDLISIFLPTTPNPTSGFLLFIPREDCIFLKMGITEGMRLVVSGGVVAPHQPLTTAEEKIFNDLQKPFMPIPDQENLHDTPEKTAQVDNKDTKEDHF